MSYWGGQPNYGVVVHATQYAVQRQANQAQHVVNCTTKPYRHAPELRKGDLEDNIYYFGEISDTCLSLLNGLQRDCSPILNIQHFFCAPAKETFFVEGPSR